MLDLFKIITIMASLFQKPIKLQIQLQLIIMLIKMKAKTIELINIQNLQK